MNEEVLMLGRSKALVSVLSTTEKTQYKKTAVLLLNAGRIHHVGPSRLYVNLARALARQGLSTLRFDYSGIGDSPVRLDSMPILEVAVAEPREIMDDLGARGYEQFILMGICSGAYCSFQTACLDERVIGAVLINPDDFVGVPGLQKEAWVTRYATKSIVNPRAWINFFTGKVAYGRLFSTLIGKVVGYFSGQNKELDTSLQDAKKQVIKLVERQARLLFVLSAQDSGIAQLKLVMGADLAALQARSAITVVEISGADHLFTRLQDQQQVIDEISTWALWLLNAA